MQMMMSWQCCLFPFQLGQALILNSRKRNSPWEKDWDKCPFRALVYMSWLVDSSKLIHAFSLLTGLWKEIPCSYWEINKIKYHAETRHTLLQLVFFFWGAGTWKITAIPGLKGFIIGRKNSNYFNSFLQGHDINLHVLTVLTVIW